MALSQMEDAKAPRKGHSAEEIVASFARSGLRWLRHVLQNG
jgi:hypothetical protein